MTDAPPSRRVSTDRVSVSVNRLTALLSLLPPKPITTEAGTFAYQDPNAAERLHELRSVFDAMMADSDPIRAPSPARPSFDAIKRAIADGFTNGNEQYDEQPVMRRMDYDNAAMAVARLFSAPPEREPGDELVPIYCKPWRTIVFVKEKHKADFLEKNDPPSVAETGEYEACHHCSGSGLQSNLMGEPTECRHCKGNTVLPATPPAPSAASGIQLRKYVGITDDQIKYMVERFLRWRLPENFSPDCGISFTRFAGTHEHPHEYKPVGTNLLDFQQATAMVWYMVQGLEVKQAFEDRVLPSGAGALTWSRLFDPNEECRYDHCYADTPFGRYQIEWKGWKDSPGFTLVFGGEFITVPDDLISAKEAALKDYMSRLASALSATEDAKT